MRKHILKPGKIRIQLLGARVGEFLLMRLRKCQRPVSTHRHVSHSGFGLVRKMKQAENSVVGCVEIGSADRLSVEMQGGVQFVHFDLQLIPRAGLPS